jgi:hypothetical protein
MFRRQFEAATAPLLSRNVVELRDARRQPAKHSVELFRSQLLRRNKQSQMSTVWTEVTERVPQNSAAELSTKTQRLRSVDGQPVSETAPPTRARFDRNTQSEAVKGISVRRTAPPADLRFVLSRKTQRETLNSDDVESTTDWRTKRRFDRARDSTTSGVDKKEWNTEDGNGARAKEWWR